MPASRKTPVLGIHKFGGASLFDAAAVRHAATLIAAQKGGRLVVASAMAGVTDALLQGATRAALGDGDALCATATALRTRHLEAARVLVKDKVRRRALEAAIVDLTDELELLARGLAVLRELTPRTSDYIVARGERLSARLLASTLAELGVKSEYVDATEVVRTDDTYGGAAPDFDGTEQAARDRLAARITRGVVPVVPGFIGRSASGHVATLGRGGSDLTATLLARALKATSITLWKDVAGFLTADPRIVSDAQVIPQLTPREAAELAYYGAKVLHPRALIPLGDRNIPIRIRPFADPDFPGTEISRRRTLREYPVKAISSVSGLALLTVTGNGMLGVPGIAARTFAALHRERVSVSLISQASSEHSICFSVPESSADAARRALLAAFAEEIAHRDIDGVEVHAGVSTLAVVGMGMSGTPGIAARVFDALATGGINVVAIAQGSSELNISVVVDSRDTTAAVRRIHGAFQLNRIGGGRLVRHDQVDVVLLGFGQIGRALARMLPRAKQDGVTLRIVGAIDRSGFVFDAAGFSTRRLTQLVNHKASGQGLATADGARSSSASEAVREIARHALSHPILVDVTADDTLPALKLALSSGMDLVMANKRPLGGPLADAKSLLDLAATQGRRMLHETTVGAGLPIIDTFHKLVESGDRVLKIEGCTSGTLGFLLDEVSKGKKFSEALKRAMQLGFTEPDARDDLSGMDVARKALILARLIGYQGELKDIAVESLVPDALRSVSRDDFVARIPEMDALWETRARQARDKGQVWRYVARISRQRVTVSLQAVPLSSPFAALKGTDNQVVFTTMRYRENPLVITGPGAGPQVTAAGVVNDVLKL
ncbi:MAG TPA: bifunctional aspartate kinase/homoserine dehydrogenase I, partial [Gemmatimonadaceae bacterium]|nr:bifunctional aspartate kinase/homoserine dehydrogenase I [Gemmatimonadaceae bacterium]